MSSKSKFLYGLLILLVVAGGIAFWKQDELYSWYHARMVMKADDDQRQLYLSKLLCNGSAGFRATVALLRHKERDLCQSVGLALEKFLGSPKLDGVGREKLMRHVVQAWSTCSPEGQLAAMDCLANTLSGMKQRSREMNSLCTDLIRHASASSASGAGVFQIAKSLLEEGGDTAESVASQIHKLLESGLKSSDEATRLAALKLAVQIGDGFDPMITPMVVGSKLDESAEIRVQALLALRDKQDQLPTPDLARLLHDESLEVRKVCESILKTRQVSADQIQLFRLFFDSSPQSRSKVPFLVLDQGLDASKWIGVLAQDPSPTVRAAVAKALCYLGDTHHRSMLEQLVQKETDPDVMQIARFYLEQWKDSPVKAAGHEERNKE